MAHDDETRSGISHDIGLDTMGYALAGLAGTGVVLMILALALGVIDTAVTEQTSGEAASGGAQAVMFGLGLIALLTGSAAWFFYVRPDTRFDDIDVPLDAEPHGHHADDDAHHDADGHDTHSEDAALLPAQAQTTPHGH